ncbi:MAG TPA: hypothetical protein VHY82_10270, partial [Acetobacteraceae bacterium]|nr:hypothetical protein [Acetobacteraceae bacterium]
MIRPVRRLAEKLTVELAVLIRDKLQAEIPANPCGGILGKMTRSTSAAEQLEDSPGKKFRISWWNHKTAPGIAHHVGTAGHTGGDDRHFRQRRFQ